jgi:5-formyltetrahydrofolate cyclo-ligase
MKNGKEEIRHRVWKRLEEEEVALPPKPCWGRIPNFKGAEIAAEKLRKMKTYQRSAVISVNPDSPQRCIREMVLQDDKTLIMGTPKLEEGFLILKDLTGYEKGAATIPGSLKYGKKVQLKEIPVIDMKIVGSVAVSRNGGRLGKGTGYFDVGYGVFRELGVMNDKTPIITTVHDLQIVDSIPMTEHDVPVDLIITPTTLITTKTPYLKPSGLPWHLISENMFRRLSILNELRSMKSLKSQ